MSKTIRGMLLAVLVAILGVSMAISSPGQQAAPAGSRLPQAQRRPPPTVWI